MASALSGLENQLGSVCLENNPRVPEENIEKWGLPLKELYRLALMFYKDKSGKAIHLSYEDNLKLIAFTQQATLGPFNPDNVPQLGVLDVIGRDRRLAWQNLGSISKTQAMEDFINLLDGLCPALRPYIEAVKKDKEERLKKSLEEKIKQQEAKEKQKLLLEEQKQREEQRNTEEVQKIQLQEALNQQTYHQFKAYAEKQFPGSPEQQAVLVRQLQNEHYHQYMQQLQAQSRTTTKIDSKATNTEQNENPINVEEKSSKSQENEDSENNVNNNCCSDKELCSAADDSSDYIVISPAKMWTRPDIKAFKQEVSAGSGDGVILVGHGDTVTVRVPTHEGGNCIFWEFATDNYDIGFGVYFEWGRPVTNEVTVHVSESDDDEELFDEDDDEYQSGDLECGPLQSTHRSSISQNRPPISIIVPVYRRECQNEVYVGSHNYPGEGVYLLKFDNSFSIWRSKTLYYRVYYER